LEGVRDILVSLSSLARSGWMLRGVPHVLAESVADHSFWSSVIGFELAVRLREKGYEINPYRVAVLALLHDVGEAIIGDIAKTAGLEEAKENAEARAVEKLPLSSEAKTLIREFMNGDSGEACVARVAEVTATVLRAQYYEELGFTRVSEIKRNLLTYIRGLPVVCPYFSDLREAIWSVVGIRV